MRCKVENSGMTGGGVLQSSHSGRDGGAPVRRATAGNMRQPTCTSPPHPNGTTVHTCSASEMVAEIGAIAPACLDASGKHILHALRHV
jgi:hypothetical protein